MQKLWIVRHGQTNWNLSQRIQGWTDIPLNETGIQQATLLHKYICGIPFRKFFASDLVRATETAKILAANQHHMIEICPDLRERCFGKREGTVRQDFSEAFLDNVPDAEPMSSVIARGIRFLDFLKNEYPPGRYLCVTHGGMIRSVLNHLGAQGVTSLSNTGVTVLKFVKDKWIINCIDWKFHEMPNKESNEPIKVSTAIRVLPAAFPLAERNGQVSD